MAQCSHSCLAGPILRAVRVLGEPMPLLVAAAYELTPLKDACLGRCRSPLGFLLGSWRSGRKGALRMGALNGA